MKRINGEKFSGQAIQLDGTHWHDCSFADCHIIFAGKEPFAFSGSTTAKIQNCSFELSENARLTMQALNSLYVSGGTFKVAVEAILQSFALPPVQSH